MGNNIPVPPEEFITGRERQLGPDTRSLTPDATIAGRQADAAQVAPLGSPPLDYLVRSVYDSRPVNGQDFNICSSVTAAGTETSLTVSMTVPPGYIAVVRRVHTELEPGPPITLRRQVQASLQRNSVTIPFQEGIFVGTAQDTLLESFVLADENDTVSVTLSYFTSAEVVNTFPAGTVFEAQFYGNFLAKTGRPYNFEIANPSMGEPKSRYEAPLPIHEPSPIQPPKPLPAPVTQVIHRGDPIAVRARSPMFKA